MRKVSVLAIAIVLFIAGSVSANVLRPLGGQGTRAAAEQAPSQPTSPATAAASPDFSNRVLHWQKRVYHSSAAGSDSKSNTWAVTDTWVSVGAANQPLAAHAVTTVNHQFNQAVIYDFTNSKVTFVGFSHTGAAGPAAGTVLAGPPAVSPTPVLAIGAGSRAAPPAGAIVTAPAGPPASAPSTCVATQSIPPSSLPKALANALPPYVNTSKLPDGFQSTSRQLETAPTLDKALSPSGVTANPVSVLTASGVVTFAAPNRGDVTGLLGLDGATGRQVAWESFRQGTLNYAELSSPVELYAPADIPVSLFSADSVQGACRG